MDLARRARSIRRQLARRSQLHRRREVAGRDPRGKRRGAAAAYEVDASGLSSRGSAGDKLELELQPIRNPVSGAEVHPAAVLPEGIVFREAAFGASKTFTVSDGVSYDHSGKYTAVGPFEYSGP